MIADRVNTILKADEGKRITILGNQITIKVSGENTNGAYSMAVYTAAPGYAGPPLHRHDFDEFFYVLEGEIVLDMGEERIRATAGDSVFVPGGAPHTFSNPGTKPATFQFVLNPAGFEKFFEEVAERFEAAGGPDMSILAELNRKYGVVPVK